MARSEGISARDRARQARIALDKKRAEQMRSVEEATLGFFKAEEAAEAARAQLEDAERDRAVAVQRLGELGVKNAEVADMLGLTEKEVRALAKVKLDGIEQDELPSGDAATATP